jgi:hypothetical protein
VGPTDVTGTAVTDTDKPVFCASLPAVIAQIADAMITSALSMMIRLSLSFTTLTRKK